MGAPFKELDDKAIAKAHLIPKEIALYLSHHLRNDLAAIMFIAQKLENYAVKHDSVEIMGHSEKLFKKVESIAADMARIGI